MDAKRGAISNRANGRLSRINREKRERERERLQLLNHSLAKVGKV